MGVGFIGRIPFRTCLLRESNKFIPPTHTAPDHEVNETFGGDKGAELDWFLPTTVVFPSSIKEEIYGFCVPCDDKEENFARMATLV